MSRIAAGTPKSPEDKEYDNIRHTRYVPPQVHFDTIGEELTAALADPASVRRTEAMAKRAMREPMLKGLTSIDWKKELANFKDLAYPDYYLKPFHSVPGGWLSRIAAVFDRQFMQAIYKETHAGSCMGIRADLSKLISTSSRRVVDLGCGIGDSAACHARALPDAEVLAIDASPFMITAGRLHHAGLPNLRFLHRLAEDTGLPDGSVDCVTITLVFHECSEAGKTAIAQEVKRILKPGGVLVFADTPQDDLLTYRGAYEPYRDEWVHFRPAEFFGRLGFCDFQDRGVIGGALVSEAEQRNISGERTDNRLFVFTVKKDPWVGSKL